MTDDSQAPVTAFPLHLNPETAWMIRGAILPGIGVDWPKDSIPAHADGVARTIRRKANNAILRMIDERIKDVEVDCTEDEAWLLDGSIPFDGRGGSGTDLLLQIMRGLWYLDIGQHLTGAAPLVEDPRGEWSNTAFKQLGHESDPSCPRPHP